MMLRRITSRSDRRLRYPHLLWRDDDWNAGVTIDVPPWRPRFYRSRPRDVYYLPTYRTYQRLARKHRRRRARRQGWRPGR